MKRHLIVFLITASIFTLVLLFTSFENSLKRKEIAELQGNVLIDLMANETQFDLLKTAPCDTLLYGSRLSSKMDEIGKKLTYAESLDNNEEIQSLKKYYSLLEIRDYLLSQDLIKKCPEVNVHSIVYFYKENCRECEKQGYVLTEVKRRYPWVRIYSFDYDLDFPIIQTFGSIYHISRSQLPSLIVEGKLYTGFHSVEDIELAIPDLKKEKIEEQYKDFLKYTLGIDVKDRFRISCLQKEASGGTREREKFYCRYTHGEEDINAVWDGKNFSLEKLEQGSDTQEKKRK